MKMKYNVMEQQTDTEVRRAQVVYLYHVLDKAPKEIAQISGYAVATVRSYVTKFIDLLDYAKSIFENIAKKLRTSKYDACIKDNGLDIRAEGREMCYLFRFYDINDKLICSKVGTTTRSVRKRLIEELRSKTYSEMGAVRAEVDRVYDCGELPAEGLESLLRSEYIKKYPKSFKKNDRFIGQLFDLETCDHIAKTYLA